MFAQRLQRARKAAGLSLRALAEAAGVSHGAIQKYEDGRAMPSSPVLLALAKALQVRTEYFFRTEAPQLEGLEFRKRSSLGRKREQAIEGIVLDQIERRLELERLFPRPPVETFALPADLPACLSDMAAVEAVAEAMRHAWELGLNPIADLVDEMECRGIRIFAADTDADAKFDGLAARVGGEPVVVVNRHLPGDRQRFTLAHELGHLVLRGRLAPQLEEEKACHRFAGAFLLPASALRRELGAGRRTRLEMRELLLLKREFGLSMQAVLFRAFDLGLLAEREFRAEMAAFRARGWHVREPGGSYPAEQAHHFEQLVFHALAEDYIGESKAAELLSLPLPEFRQQRVLAGDATPHQ